MSSAKPTTTTATTLLDASRNTLYQTNIGDYIQFLENKLDKDLGNYFWKKYVAAAFWAQFSTPLNLAITVLTAMTTAQANSPNLLTESIYMHITYAALILTTLNTFFRPHTQLNTNADSLRAWSELGIEFEDIYYSSPRGVHTVPEMEDRIARYKVLQNKINTLRKTEGAISLNFLTDLLHIIAMRTCILRYRSWLDQDKIIRREIHIREKNEARKMEEEKVEDALYYESLAKRAQDRLKLLKDKSVMAPTPTTAISTTAKKTTAAAGDATTIDVSTPAPTQTPTSPTPVKKATPAAATH